ncbi:TPA: hypothetical protein ACQW0B_002135, partial [Streptococcus pneumoniae]
MNELCKKYVYQLQNELNQYCDNLEGIHVIAYGSNGSNDLSISSDFDVCLIVNDDSFVAMNQRLICDFTKLFHF